MDIGKILREETLEHFDLKPAAVAELDTPLFEVVRAMQDKRTGCASIVEGGVVKGVFTERDLITRVLGKGVDLSKPVKDYMTPDPHVLKPTDSVAQAIELINRYRHRSIPLVDDQKRLAGLITVRSIITFLAEHFPTEVYNLPPSPEIMDETAEGG